MENQDKLYEQFKGAADKAEGRGFARMDAVWNRVEEKLDNKKQRRAAASWKYTGMAAVLLFFITVGTFLYRENTPGITPQGIPENNVTVIDTQKVKETFDPARENAVPEEVVVVNPIPEDEGQDHQATSVNDGVLVYDTLANGRIIPRKVPTPQPLPYAFFPVEGKERAKAKYYTTTSDFSAKEAAPIAGDGTITFTGTITDSQGMPIPGVTVAAEGTAKGVQTDFDGKYTLKIKEGEKVVASYVGMESVGILGYKANDNKTLQLTDDVATLDEVVVESYRTTTRAVSNAAVTSITTEEIEAKPGNGYVSMVEGTESTKTAQKSGEKAFKDGDKRLTSPKYFALTTASSKTIEGRPNASVIQSLQGQAVGVTIATPSGQPSIERKTEEISGNDYNPTENDIVEKIEAGNASIKEKTPYETYMKDNYWDLGETDADGIDDTTLDASGVMIRGAGSINTYQEPLVVLDGVPLGNSAMQLMNPDNIETITVLKDASATALYGSRGANGVIIIKSKKRLGKRAMRKIAEEVQQLDREKQEYLETLPEPIMNPYRTIENTPLEKIQIDTEEYESFEENKFENPATAPLSTFSIDVDNASYTNIRRFLNNGQVVPKDAVRVEEMINFFKYQYPQPTGKDPFSINTEYSDAPWNPKHKLLKIGLQGKIIADEVLPASNFVYLIDVSGSMSDSNKLPLVKESMKVLVKQMRPKDRIAIVVYAGAAGLVLPSTSGAEKATIIAALDNLNAGGSTAGGEGIELAYKTAQENFIKDGNNRVILATDGDFNVGDTSDEDMETLIEEKRKGGVFLTCLGYGMGNYKDAKLETLADKGNGNYAYIDNMQEAGRFLQKEFKGSMYAIAKDVKIQIEFNPKHVQSYRLIGYENRKLRDEDFANDAIDAGELGSGHTVTALYEIIPVGVESELFTPTSELKYSTPAGGTGNYNEELATIKFRHKKPDGDKSTEMVKVIPNAILPFDRASGDFKFAAAVAWFGLKLRDSKLVPNKSTADIMALAKEGLLNDPEGYRFEFLRLVDRVE